jgi:hypothetical protein
MKTASAADGVVVPEIEDAFIMVSSFYLVTQASACGFFVLARTKPAQARVPVPLKPKSPHA